MKIQKELQPINDSRVKISKGVSESPSTFNGMIKNQQTQLHSDVLSQLIDKIDQQGQRLLSTQTVKDLQQYKKLIHQFINETVSHGLSLKQTRSWFQQGGSKMTTIHKINEKLVDMTNQVVTLEKDSVQLLQQIGELKGLLINLYR